MCGRRAKPADREISVVVQGPVFHENQLTARALTSIRRTLPGAELILSTWEDADTEGLDFDRLVKSPDPGGMYLLFPGGAPCPNNLSRQMISTQSGLKVATQPYTLKFRTDLQLSHAGFLNFQALFQARSPEWRLFSERLVIPDHYSRNPARHNHRLPAEYAPAAAQAFHPSDMAAFGKTEDLKRLWDVPLPGWGSELPPRERASIDPCLLSKRFVRMLSEQYLWTECLRLASGFEVDPAAVNAPAMWETSEKTIANNFTIVRRAQFGLLLPKHPFQQGTWSSLYTYRDIAELYRKYCDPNAPLPFDFAHTLKNFTFIGPWAATPAGRAVRWLIEKIDFVKQKI